MNPSALREVAAFAGAGGARELATRFGIAAAAVALIFGALWLRAPSVPYLAACALATVVAGYGVPGRGRIGRRRSLALALSLIAFCLLAGLGQRRLSRVDTAWDELRRSLETAGAQGAAEAIEREGRRLIDVARRALDAPDGEAEAFRALAPLATGASERGVVLYRDNRPFAWSGIVRVDARPVGDTSSARIDALASPLYLTLRATAARGNMQSVAVLLLHAQPPADRISRPLDALLSRRFDVESFRYTPGDDSTGGAVVTVAEWPVLRVSVAPLEREAARLRMLERIRLRNGLVFALALGLLIAAAWRPMLSLGERVAVLGVSLVVVGIVPLNAFSNATKLFDPSFYFAPLGRAYTASVGALGITAGLLLLAILSIQRARVRLPKHGALALLLALVAMGPFLLRDLARGISSPPWGVSLTLWAAWQGTLFLAAMVVLLGTVAVGRTIVSHQRGISPWIAALLALIAALLGPILWRAPGGWPDWYAALWAAAIGTFALARRTRWFLIIATIVAGTGAASLVWGSTARRRVELATRDVAALAVPDSFGISLLTRLGRQLDRSGAPQTRVELLQSLAMSDIAAAGFPVHLAAWDASDTVRALLAPAPFAEPWDALELLVASARRENTPMIAQARGIPGVQLLLAVPHAGGSVTTAAVAPRTRLVPDPPFGALIGLQSPGGTVEPPYAISLGDAHPHDLAIPASGRWQRRGNELHGDWLIPGPVEPGRAHVEVDLRSLPALIQRGTLLVLGDLLLVGALWAVTVAAGGGAGRWLRVRRKEWLRSYRARLTIVLFAFFMIPAGAFAVWSYQRLLADDVQSRVLLVGETLRAAAATGDTTMISEIAANFGTPLMLFAGGELTTASDDLLREVAPVGRFLPPDVMLSLGIADELTAARSFAVGGDRVVLGYRSTQSAAGERYVLAAPARSRELELENRRRDLAVLVAFATAIGALAALWLSGVAARELASPIGALRYAALDLAAGRRSPDLGTAPPSEFQPVFSAFRRMARDLDASRRALEEAERRILAVLRDVASGVIAVDRTGAISLANTRAEALVGAQLAPGEVLNEQSLGNLATRVREFIAAVHSEDEFDVEVAGRQLHARLTRLERGDGGAVLTLDDLSELARAQRVLAWGEMARQVAHEIKNPLTPIRLGVQHLRRARSDPRVNFDEVLETNVDRILAEIDRLDEIARAFSRYGLAPDQRPAATPIDVAAIARDTVALERMGQSALEWRLENADEPAWAMANAEELREALLNLLENARHARATAVRVRISRNVPAAQVIIEVADDGEGIAADALPRVFEPHFSTRTSGSGLGLAITRRLVEGWGGHISVTSRAQEGTTVVVALAAAQGNGEIS